MLYTVTKTYRTSNDHISYGLTCRELPAGYCSGFHGYSGLSKDAFDVLKQGKEPKHEFLSGCAELFTTFQVTTQELADMGLTFHINKTDEISYASVNNSIAGHVNPYYLTVDVVEMERHVKAGLVFKSDTAMREYKDSKKVLV